MEKLFTDAETFTKVRPTKITEQQEQDFYKSIAEEIIENGWSDSDLEDVIADVSNISTHDSGYEIAKDLEGYGSKASYDIDTPFIEFLDNFGYEKDCILRKNVEAWVNAHNPQPKFQKGQKLIVETTLNYEKKKGETVYITGFSEKQACYLIDKDEKRQGGTVIAYEKVESNCNPI
jgi:hypothetical protein